MTVLALDPGLRTGWCRGDGRNGVLDLSGYSDRGEAIAIFQRWLADEFAQHPTLYLATEKPFHFSRPSAISDFTGGLLWAANAVAWMYDVPRTQRSAADVRKWLIGRPRRRKGESEKEFDAAILAAVQAHGFHPASEHSADAAALLIACEAHREPMAA